MIYDCQSSPVNPMARLLSEKTNQFHILGISDFEISKKVSLELHFTFLAYCQRSFHLNASTNDELYQPG